MRVLSLLLFCCLLMACGGGGDSASGTAADGLILTAAHGDRGTAWGLANCDSCHSLAVMHRDTTAAIRNSVRAQGYDTCMGCHGSNGTTLSRPCVVCHNDQALPDVPPLDGQHSHRFVVDSRGGMSDTHCLTCHYASDMNGEIDVNVDLTLFTDANGSNTPYATATDFCLRCHNRDRQQPGFEITGTSFDDPLIAIEDDYRHFDYHGWRDGSGQGTYSGLRAGYDYSSLVVCSDCHAMHGTDNEQLIIDSSAKGVSVAADSAVTLTPRTVFVGADGDYAQLCVLCHRMEITLDDGAVNTGNGLSGVHAVGEDCRPCHTHGEAVQAGL